MTEKKTLPFLRNQNWEKVKVQNKKINKILPTIQLTLFKKNESFHARAKLACDKNRCSSKELE